MLSSKSFTVLHSTLRSVIHFELIFVKGVRSVSRFFVCVCLCVCVCAFFVQLFHYYLIKRCNCFLNELDERRNVQLHSFIITYIRTFAAIALHII